MLFRSRTVGPVAILTPDAQNSLIREAIEKVNVKTWKRNSGTTFGPYKCEWELQDEAVANAMLAEIILPQQVDYREAVEALSSHSHKPAIASALRRLDHDRRTRGHNTFSGTAIAQLVHDAVRNQSRLGVRRGAKYMTMTIHRAKNREFSNVVVLWPYTATGGSEHLRRMLYNAITRATNHCSVIVLGQRRLDGPPFSPALPD